MPMTNQEMDLFLAESRNAIVATVNPDGFPQLTPIWFLWEDGKVFFSTTEPRLKTRNLKRDPRVSLCIDEIDKKTTVVILGDARNNFGPEKAHLMKIINERSKQVFWLNPEGKYRWDSGDSVMTTYSAYCTKVFQCGNIEQLERVISTLLKTAI